MLALPTHRSIAVAGVSGVRSSAIVVGGAGAAGDRRARDRRRRAWSLSVRHGTRGLHWAPRSDIDICMRHVSVVAAAAAAVVTLAGCGGEQHASTAGTARPATNPPAAKRSSVVPRPIVLRDQLFSVEHRWAGFAIADRLAIDRHGAGRIVRAGGGGGLRIERCRFSAAEMAGWRHDLRLIGGAEPTGTSPQRQPATFIIDYRSRQRVVQTGAIPKRYRPLTQRITRLLYRGGNGCRTMYSQRPPA
jgi:hypothetical protein